MFVVQISLLIVTFPSLISQNLSSMLPSKKSTHTLEESLSITTGHCELAIATHVRKMYKKNINMIVNWSILVSYYLKPPGGQAQRFFNAFS